MKRIGLIYLGLLLTTMTYGQIVKFQVGTSISKLDWQVGNNNFTLYSETLVSYSTFLGLDYLDKKYYNLSSNIGFIRKGGQDNIKFTNENGEILGDTIAKAYLDYLSLNSMVDLKYSIKDRFAPFISIGPRFDYLISNNIVFDDLKDINELNNISFGLIVGGGIKYNILKLQFGVRADYYLNFLKVAKWPVVPGNLGGEVADNTFTVNLTIGYKL